LIYHIYIIIQNSWSSEKKISSVCNPFFPHISSLFFINYLHWIIMPLAGSYINNDNFFGFLYTFWERWKCAKNRQFSAYNSRYRESCGNGITNYSTDTSSIVISIGNWFGVVMSVSALHFFLNGRRICLYKYIPIYITRYQFYLSLI